MLDIFLISEEWCVTEVFSWPKKNDKFFLELDSRTNGSSAINRRPPVHRVVQSESSDLNNHNTVPTHSRSVHDRVHGSRDNLDKINSRSTPNLNDAVIHSPESSDSSNTSNYQNLVIQGMFSRKCRVFRLIGNASNRKNRFKTSKIQKISSQFLSQRCLLLRFAFFQKIGQPKKLFFSIPVRKQQDFRFPSSRKRYCLNIRRDPTLGSLNLKGGLKFKKYLKNPSKKAEQW